MIALLQYLQSALPARARTLSLAKLTSDSEKLELELIHILFLYMVRYASK